MKKFKQIKIGIDADKAKNYIEGLDVYQLGIQGTPGLTFLINGEKIMLGSLGLLELEVNKYPIILQTIQLTEETYNHLTKPTSSIFPYVLIDLVYEEAKA